MYDGGWFYANSKLAAINELVRRPEAQDDPSLQNEICRKHGVFLDSMTEDEFSEFEHLLQEQVKARKEFLKFLDTL